jgi:hypothetical protein
MAGIELEVGKADGGRRRRQVFDDESGKDIRQETCKLPKGRM